MPSTPSRFHTVLTASAVAASAILLAVQLLVPPIVGLANNADFEKVMGYVGLQYTTEVPSERYFSFALREFQRVPPGWYRSGYHTSETLLAGIARFASEPFARQRVFDIRVLGALHAILLCAAIGLLVAACRGLAPITQVVVAALLVFFFTDVGYAAPLNSLYSQTASLLFLLLTAGWAAGGIRRGGLAGWRLPLYFLFALLFVAAKPQHAVHGLLLALLGWRLASPRARRTSGALAAGLVLASAVSFLQAPRIIRHVALYHTVFREMLPHSPNPASDLRALGLDEDLLSLSGTTAYDPRAPIWQPAFSQRFFDRYGYGALVRFYATRPARLAGVLQRASKKAFRLRPWGFGNFEKSRGLAPFATTSRFAVWSRWRGGLARGAPLWIALLVGGTIALCAATWRRASAGGRLVREALATLAIMAALEFLVCALANAHLELERQLFAFQAMCDLLLIALAGWLVETLARGREKSDRRSDSRLLTADR